MTQFATAYSTPSVMPDKSIIVKKNHSTKINQLYSNGAILDNYGRFEDNLSCDSALKRNYKTIISMINLKQPQEKLVLAIKAAKVAGLTPAIVALEQIVASSQDQNLIIIAKDAISYIKSNPASDNYQKWEVE